MSASGWVMGERGRYVWEPTPDWHHHNWRRDGSCYDDRCGEREYLDWPAEPQPVAEGDGSAYWSEPPQLRCEEALGDGTTCGDPAVAVDRYTDRGQCLGHVVDLVSWVNGRQHRLQGQHV